MLAALLLAACQPGQSDPPSGTTAPPSAHASGPASGAAPTFSWTQTSSPTHPTGGTSSTDTGSSSTDTATDHPARSQDSGAGAGHQHPGIEDCELADLPATTLDTIADIEAGGPYPHPRNDGTVFRNDEGLLPEQSRGYYHEYTVQTPGADTRGARRIVTGGEDPDLPDDPEHWFYTGDHYESFCEFLPS